MKASPCAPVASPNFEPIGQRYSTYIQGSHGHKGYIASLHPGPPPAISHVFSPYRPSSHWHLQPIRRRTMDAQQDLPHVPSNVTFRVLIIGRANAGKTSILQRVCGTTESPEMYSVDSGGRRIPVLTSSFVTVVALPISSSNQIQLELDPSMEVCLLFLSMTADRDYPSCAAWRT
jgi:hypothetical protein